MFGDIVWFFKVSLLCPVFLKPNLDIVDNLAIGRGADGGSGGFLFRGSYCGDANSISESERGTLPSDVV